MRLFSSIVLLTIMSFTTATYAAVPTKINFQGVLFDDNNQVVNGNVNFNFSLHDAITAGVQLWSENQNNIAVSAGIYSVALGSATPITTNTLESGAVFLEITVNSETLVPRQQLLTVPYALKANEAENVSGISGVFIQQLFQNVDWDGQNIANDDPLEGFTDLDGDGLANFLDPDNDGDGFLDNTEVSNGTGVNLITPNLTNVSPPAVDAGTANTVTVTGTGFLAGLTVQVGTETPIATNVTSTSFDITIGIGQNAGSSNLVVTNPNGETASSSVLFYVYENLAFVTSTLQSNALAQDLVTADAFCAQAATNAGLSGNFIAWFSSPALSIHAKDRFSPTAGPWSRTDGLVIANDISDLTDGSHPYAINLDEFGIEVANAVVATGTNSNGNLFASSCAGSSPTTGNKGNSSSTNVNWTSNGTTACTTSLRYYCFED